MIGIAPVTGGGSMPSAFSASRCIDFQLRTTAKNGASDSAYEPARGAPRMIGNSTLVPPRRTRSTSTETTEPPTIIESARMLRTSRHGKCIARRGRRPPFQKAMPSSSATIE